MANKAFENKVKKSITIDPLLWNSIEKNKTQNQGRSSLIESLLLKNFGCNSLEEFYQKVDKGVLPNG